MSQLFLGNFDFEHTLATGHAQSLPLPIKRINAELATCWLLIAEENDSIMCPEPVEDGFWERMQAIGFPAVNPIYSEDQIPMNRETDPLRFTPWGWSVDMFQFANRHQLQSTAPEIEIIRQANSRRFSAALEDELAFSLPFAKMISSPTDFTAAVQQLPEKNNRWVVKQNLSNSARERIIGQGTEATEAEQNWMQKRWQKNILLFFEPWVDAIEEAGIHFTIPTEGEPAFDGITPLLTDASGRYCGSRILPPENRLLLSHWSQAIDIGYQVVKRLQSIGFFGPVGIDAMRYRQHDGSIAMRPLQEINARWTMGRIALGVRKILQSNEIASWLHVSLCDELIKQNQTESLRIIRTSPTHINNQPVLHQTYLCITQDVELLEKCEQKLFNKG